MTKREAYKSLCFVRLLVKLCMCVACSTLYSGIVCCLFTFHMTLCMPAYSSSLKGWWWWCYFVKQS